MFFLISGENPDNRCVILGGKIYLVGRRDCDILLSGDATVSRKHAELTVSHAEANLSNLTKLPILRLKDLSKFGTWVNSQRVQGERILQDGDTVYFGSPKSSFMVVLEPLVITSSCLDHAMKKSVKQYMVTLGGHLVPEWHHDCTLLVMGKISVTIKVICALVSQKYIVLPTYMEQYIKHLHGKAEKPDPSMFTPELAETQLDSTCVTFNPDIRRKSLFSGMKFYFLTEKQLKKMRFAIELAGGVPILLEQGKVDTNITKPGSVVMNCTDTDLSQSDDWITRVHATLDKKNKHMILDAEIGYAVLYCSTEKHCNPDYVSDEDLCKLPSQSLSQFEPFVPNTDTQSMTQVGSKRVDGKLRSESNTVIDETKFNINTQRTQTPKSTQKKQVEKAASEPKTKDQSIPIATTSQTTKKRYRNNEEEDAITNKRIKKEPVTPCKSNMDDDGDKKRTKSRQDNVQTKPKVNVQTVWDSDDDVDYSKINTEVIEPQKKMTKQAQKTSPNRDLPEPSGSKLGRGRSRSPHSPRATIKSEPVATPSPRLSKTENVPPRDDNKLNENKKKRIGRRGQDVVEGEPAGLSSQEDKKPVVLHTSDNKPASVPAGFLSTRHRVKGQVKQSGDYEYDEDLPTGCVTVETVSLVFHRPQKTTANSGDCPEGFTRWKGKLVRNFKKFRKTCHAGSQSLPHIIGGSDLEIHVAKRSKELDDWFKDSVQTENEHNAEDRRMERLFDLKPGTRRGK